MDDSTHRNFVQHPITIVPSANTIEIKRHSPQITSANCSPRVRHARHCVNMITTTLPPDRHSEYHFTQRPFPYRMPESNHIRAQWAPTDQSGLVIFCACHIHIQIWADKRWNGNFPREQNMENEEKKVNVTTQLQIVCWIHSSGRCRRKVVHVRPPPMPPPFSSHSTSCLFIASSAERRSAANAKTNF